MEKLTKEEEYAIIQQVVDGNSNAYRHLVKQYERYVYSAAYKIMGNTHDAEDVAQDTFVKAYRKLKQFQFQSRFSTWLYRIAINTAISIKRKRKFYATDIQEETIENRVSNKNHLKHDDQKEFLQQAFEQLKEEDVSILTLFYLQELRLDEIAEVLQIEANTAKVRLYRARKRLAEQLQMILHDEAKNLL